MLDSRSDPVTSLILAEESRLFRTAMRLARCEADALDLVQSTLMRAYRARRRFKPGTSIRAWTSTIMRRVFLTDVIRAKRRATKPDSDALALVIGRPWRPEDEQPTSMGRLVEGLDGRTRRALERLPKYYREAFLLSVVEELSCADVARRLGVAEGTAMSRIHRARERLKSDLVYGSPARRLAV
jgi:RNA polymerase sigma-70 factor (ECF subfamily)